MLIFLCTYQRFVICVPLPEPRHCHLRCWPACYASQPMDRIAAYHLVWCLKLQAWMWHFIHWFYETCRLHKILFSLLQRNQFSSPLAWNNCKSGACPLFHASGSLSTSESVFLEYSVKSHYFVDFLHAKKRSWVICVIEWPISSCNLLLEGLYVVRCVPNLVALAMAGNA
jgi:hypothetical protein